MTLAELLNSAALIGVVGLALRVESRISKIETLVQILGRQLLKGTSDG